MWHYEVPPKITPLAMNDPMSFYTGQLPTNLEHITITFKSAHRPAEQIPLQKALPNPRIQPIEDEPEPRRIEMGKEMVRVNNGRSSPHPNAHQRRALLPNDEEKRKREELEKMKAEFAFPTTLFETTAGDEGSQVEELDPVLTRTSFLNEEDFEDQNE